MPPVKKTEAVKKEKHPYTVIIRGEDRTVMAEDEDDLKRQIEKITATFPS